MKICFIAPVPPPYGGIANWYLLVSKYIRHCKNNIVLSTINIAPKKRATEGRSILSRVFISGFEMLKKIKELKNLIRQNHPDVIHMTTSGQLAIIRDILLLHIARKHKIPTVYHIRFGRVPEMSKANTLEWKIFKKAAVLATTVIAIDHATESVLKIHLPEINVEYIPNPFDISFINDIPEKKERKTIVFIGWVIKTKGIEDLLSAWNIIHANYSDYTLKIVGPVNDDYMEFLKQQYSLNHVVFMGEQAHESTLRILNDCDIFVLPSHTEGFPNTVLEAMALKKPIVATSVGAIPDMLANECGIVIEPKSDQKIAGAIKLLIDMPEFAERMGMNAYNKLINEYEINIVYDRYLDLWQKTCFNASK